MSATIEWGWRVERAGWFTWRVYAETRQDGRIPMEIGPRWVHGSEARAARKAQAYAVRMRERDECRVARRGVLSGCLADSDA